MRRRRGGGGEGEAKRRRRRERVEGGEINIYPRFIINVYFRVYWLCFLEITKIK